MNVYTKTKVLFKFGRLERPYVEMRSKKQLKFSHVSNQELISAAMERLTQGSAVFYVS